MNVVSGSALSQPAGLLRAEQASTDASALVDITAVLQPPPSLRDTGREVGGRDLAVGNTSQANAT
jgi:hypothetical protein